jgi:hypothetical protein
MSSFQLFSNGMRESEEKELVIKINVKVGLFWKSAKSLTFSQSFRCLARERMGNGRQGRSAGAADDALPILNMERGIF